MTELRRSPGAAKPETREPRQPDKPEVGFFRYRIVRGGAWVGARIARICTCTIHGGPGNEEHDWQPDCDRFPHLIAQVNGVFHDAPINRSEVPTLEKVWLFGERIEEADYRYMVDAAAWDRAYAPEAPAANPGQPVDLNTIDPIF